MPLPLLAFMGLGLGGAFGLDKYNQGQAAKQRGLMSQQANDLFYGRPQEAAGPTQSGFPLMSRGPSIMGGEIPPVMAAQQMMGIGGPYANAGQNILQSHLGYRAPPTSQATGPMKDAVAIGLKPGTPEYNQYIRERTMKPETQITMQQGPKLPPNYQWADPDDTSQGVVPIKGGPGEKTTEAERVSAGYLSRMQAAERGLDDLLEDEPESDEFSFKNILSGDYTISDMLGGDAANPSGIQMAAGRMAPSVIESTMLNTKQQQYLQFARDWIRAKLRKESGAVINADEWRDEYQTYFPVLGDSKEVIAQKKVARKEAEKALGISAAKAMPKQTQSRKPGDIWKEGEDTFRMNEDGSISRKVR